MFSPIPVLQTRLHFNYDSGVCCDYRTAGDQSGGKIKCQGAIDVDEIKSEITKVMEGGKDAFRLRKEKYGF